MTLRVLPAILVLSAAAFCAPRAGAQSQPWLDDRRVGGGIGLRTGNFELHPAIAGETGYDSNFYQSSGRVTGPGGGPLFNEPDVGVVRFRVTPSLTLKTLGAQRTAGDEGAATPPKVNFNAEASASFNELLATNTTYSDAVKDDRFIAVDLSGNAEILPQRPWGATLNAAYTREVQPVNDPAAPPRYGRDTVRAGAALNWRPGGGVLEWSLGYDMTYVAFESNDFSNFSSIAHSAVLRGRWLFLPRTALLYSGDYGVLTYPDGATVKDRKSVV